MTKSFRIDVKLDFQCKHTIQCYFHRQLYIIASSSHYLIINYFDLLENEQQLALSIVMVILMTFSIYVRYLMADLILILSVIHLC